MNSKHTPGPWHVGEPLACVYEDDGCRIADCDTASNVTTNKANARLIAASPDLLMALKQILCEFNQHVPEDSMCPHVRGAADNARKAIARAESEAQ